MKNVNIIHIYLKRKYEKIENKNKNITKSFYDICIENNRQDILTRWDYYKNKCTPNEIFYKSNKKMWFLCDKNINHHSESKTIQNFKYDYKETMMCKQCNSFAQWGIDNICEDFLEKYWDYNKNTLDPWNIKYGSSKRVWIKCQEKDYHGSYEVTANKFTSGRRCPYCNKNSGKIHSKDSLGQYVIDKYGQGFLNSIWSNKNKKSPFEYAKRTHTLVWWKCSNNKHNDYQRNIGDSVWVCDFRCPQCSQERNESVLQEKVRLYLETLGYTILHEEKCTIVPRNPKTHYQLPFDNEIKELKLIIEVNGKQHYKLDFFHKLSAKHFNTTPEYEFYYGQVKDRYKRIIAKQKGYYFLEIPYWTDNKNEEWKQLIDNKINEILTK